MPRFALERAPRGSRLAIGLSVGLPLLLFVVFHVIAASMLVGTAFTDWSVREISWVGLANFASLIGDPQFWMAARNTFIFVFFALVVTVPLATVVAMVLARRIRGWRVIRVLLFLPYMMPGAALALIYVVVFNPRFGLVNGILRGLGLDDWTRDWLYNVDTALIAVLTASVFYIGLYVILILAEIHSLPPEVYEAAQLDGASVGQRELWITLPLIRPIVGTCALLAVLGALGAFEGVLIMTRGGPADQTITMGLYAYYAYASGDWGVANAVGLLMLVLGILLILAIRRFARLEETDR